MSAYRQGLTGEGVKVGFVDSGINTAHVDLDDARIDGANFHADGLSFDQDVYGHGTFAAGIVAAQTDNGVGLAGVAPGPISGPTGYSIKRPPPWTQWCRPSTPPLATAAT